MSRTRISSMAFASALAVGLMILPLFPALAQEKAALPTTTQAKPTMAKICGNCHTPEQGSFRGFFESVAYKTQSIQIRMDDAVEILPDQRRAEGRGHGHAALAVDFIDEGVDEQRHRPYAFRPLRPAGLLNCQQLQRLGGRLLGTLRPVMGYHGIIWASMVIDSKCLDFRDICWL